MKAVMRALVALPAAALLLNAACSSSVSPTAPSGVPRGATIQGTVESGAGSSSAEVAAFSAAAAIRVTVVGSSLSTTTDASGRFVLQGVPGGRVTLRFQGPGTDATVEIGGILDGQTLTITVRVSGSQAVLVTPPAVGTPNPAVSPAPSTRTEVELTGTVESVTPPSLRVSGRTVLTSSTTLIRRSGRSIALSDLKPGARVEVKGTSQPDNSILASKIKVEDDDDDDEDEDDDDDDDDDDDEDEDDDDDDDGDDN